MPKPPRKQKFEKIFNDLQKVIDIDDSRGRSVPNNMNFTEEGFLTKDTGSSLFGAVETELCHSDFNYVKASGTEHRIRAKGTSLQVFDAVTNTYSDIVASPTYTAGAEFGWQVYDDELWGCNGVENYFKYDGTTFTQYASAPKGNILQIFEDRMFVSGVSTEPLSVYYSNVGNPAIFSGTDVVKPLGTDFVTDLKNYYGVLMIFKRDSIWKMTFVYEQVAAAFLPKLEQQSGNYGASSRKAVTWVENDLWFFNGREVRAIGYTDQQSGVFGINRSVISEPIKETLKLINIDNMESVATYYYNRRFYLAVPLGATNANNTVFVSHLLYGNLWTKYTDRLKSNAHGFLEVEGIVYTSKSEGDYGMVKWDDSLKADNGVAITSEVFFKKVENEEFNTFSTYRYLDLLFKNLEATITVNVREDANDNRTVKTKQFFIGSVVEGEENSLGEVDPGEYWIADSFGESVSATPFLRKKISFLSKSQSITVGLYNSSATETFTISAYSLVGFHETKALFAGSKITSM